MRRRALHEQPERDTQRMKGVLDHCLLAIIARRPMYGFEIITDLDELGLMVVAEGTIYPVLKRMNEAGLVDVEDARSHETGRMRRYYSVTAAGRRQLEQWNEEWASFAGRVGKILQVDPDAD